MISRSGREGFFKAHYDWIAAAAGLLALVAAGVYFAMSLGDDPDEAAAAAAARVDAMKPQETGVKPLDMAGYQIAVRATRNPVLLADVPDNGGSFLASERRVFCKKCKKAIPGDVKAFPNCPLCGEKQEEEAKVVLDADGDGMPDEWERKNGLNPGAADDASADADGDGFTNIEEFLAKTDPRDRNDHPDYLDSLKLQLPLRETYMPFVFTRANKIPSGWRCEFFDAKKKDDYGRMGRTVTAVIGEQIGDSGFVLKKYEAKEKKAAIKGGKGMVKSVDVSEATVERKSDSKVVVLVIAADKKTKPAPVDVQATLVYERGGTKNFEVVPGDEIDLNGTKYKVEEIKAAGKGAKATLVNSVTGKKRTIEALEQ